MSLVRSRDLAKQAGQAREIARRFNNVPAIFWGIMSNVMQAIYAPDASERDMYLSIAAKSIEKTIQDKKVSSQEHINLYLLILDMQGQHEKAISVIHQDQGMSCYTTLSHWLPCQFIYVAVLHILHTVPFTIPFYSASAFGERPILAIDSDRHSKLIELYVNTKNYVDANKLAITMIKSE